MSCPPKVKTMKENENGAVDKETANLPREIRLIARLFGIEKGKNDLGRQTGANKANSTNLIQAITPSHCTIQKSLKGVEGGGVATYAFLALVFEDEAPFTAALHYASPQNLPKFLHQCLLWTDLLNSTGKCGSTTTGDSSSIKWCTGCPLADKTLVPKFSTTGRDRLFSKKISWHMCMHHQTKIGDSQNKQ
ncbi:hypothetical protein M9H77_03448 [Catharanthus roseus]|uniref:Uncharacterized protein n=1 Tax=Catharanthus roseus TaxID=4058 RepID=A0ACC0CBB5_CATRO|nr:hypothetical protein M9H77_03448 [Catharanthus roseus]